MNKYIVTRDVTSKECPWLTKTVKKGTIVFDYSGYTYGCIDTGVAVSLEKDITPFFELPHSALGGEEGG